MPVVWNANPSDVKLFGGAAGGAGGKKKKKKKAKGGVEWGMFGLSTIARLKLL